MLVLQRLKDQEIVIGDDIRIKILKRDGKHGVKIGVIAPKNVPVRRGELIGVKVCPGCGVNYSEERSRCLNCRS